MTWSLKDGIHVEARRRATGTGTVPCRFLRMRTGLGKHVAERRNEVVQVPMISIVDLELQ